MATPSSGTIKFSDLRNEFQLSGTVRISQFYKGGTIFKVNKAVERSMAVINLPESGKLNLAILRGRFRYKSYKFTFNSGAFANKGVGDTITTGADATFASGSDAPGPYPTDIPVYAEVTIPPSTTLYGPKLFITPGSDSTPRQTTSALRVFVGSGGVNSMSVAYIINNGGIFGYGGDGGAGGGLDSDGSPGLLGGHAIVWGRTTFLENYGSILAGGGGGGGGAYSYEGSDGGSDTRSAGGGGGGGAGYLSGSGGAGGPKPPDSPTFGGRAAAGSPGLPGILTSGGTPGGGGGPSNWGPCPGGAGGTNGQSGTNGTSVTAGSQDKTGGTGGGFGKAARSQTLFSPFTGSFNVLVNSGTISGPVDQTTIFGEVSGGGGGPTPCIPTSITTSNPSDGGYAIYRTGCTITYKNNTTQTNQTLFISGSSAANSTPTQVSGVSYGQLQDYIASTYKIRLGRQPEKDGVTFWINRFNQGDLTLSQLGEAIYNAAVANGEVAKGGVNSYVDSCGNTF